MNKGAFATDEIARIRSYTEGNMDPKEAHRFELEMLNDPFLAAAVEGYSKHADWKGLDSVKQQIQNEGPGNSVWMLYGGIFSLLILTATIWLWMGTTSNPIEKQEPITVTENTDYLEDPTKEQIEQEIVDVQSTDSSVSITIDRAGLPESLPVDNFMSFREHSDIEPMEKIPTPNKALNSKLEDSREIKVPGSRIYHVRNYKLADYRGQRFAIEQAEVPVISGTPANNGLIAQHQAIPAKTSIPYIDFVEGAITRFARKEYHLAFDDFKLILSTYPDDVNAQFYGGMSAYYLGVYQVAENLLGKSEVNTIDTFRDEAAFYRAVCLFETNRREEARKIFEAIVRQKGFYAEQAGAWLK